METRQLEYDVSALEAAWGGCYRQVRYWRSGGFADLFRATAMGGVEVVLKVLRHSLAISASNYERMRLEARVGIEWSGTPGILPVVGYRVLSMRGADGNVRQLPGIAFPYLRTFNLLETTGRISAQPGGERFPAYLVAGLAVWLAEVLGTIHGCYDPLNTLPKEPRVVHADLSPTNVAWSGGVDVCTPIILDWGLCFEVAHPAHWRDAWVGTPFTMSPEQCGLFDLTGPRIDQWSLGVLAYWLRFGHHPYVPVGPDRLHVGQLQEYLRASLSFLRPVSMRPADEALLEALAPALALSPEDRYRNMREFAQALGGVCSRFKGVPLFRVELAKFFRDAPRYHDIQWEG